jgi:hypothetical protein
VTMVDGASFTEVVERTKGSPQRPFNRTDMQRKFVALCGCSGDSAFEHLLELPSAEGWREFELKLSALLTGHAVAA